MALLTRSRKRASLPFDVSKAAVVGGIAAATGIATFASRRVRALAAGKSKAAANAVTPSQTPDYDDVTLTRKVESEIFRDEDAPKGDVNVNAENGVVYLRGEAPTTELIDELVERARKIQGVHDVESLLHLPPT